MSIQFFFNDTGKIKIEKKKLAEIIRLILNDKGLDPGEIGIIFTSDRVIRKINRDYLNHDFFTDIITFENNVKQIVNGELYISIDSISKNAAKFSSFDCSRETYRVIIHGILHLSGLDDRTEPERQQMKKAEDYYLNALNLRMIKE